MIGDDDGGWKEWVRVVIIFFVAVAVQLVSDEGEPSDGIMLAYSYYGVLF